jgi:hypothetical protein
MTNSIATVDTHDLATSESGTASGALVARSWRSEPDGPYDPLVDIWYNGKWVPACFSDVRAGDFFLYLDNKLNPGLCFYAKADAKKIGLYRGHPQYAIGGATEIKQAPAIRDVNTRLEANGALSLDLKP